MTLRGAVFANLCFHFCRVTIEYKTRYSNPADAVNSVTKLKNEADASTISLMFAGYPNVPDPFL
jgi:hypothetical protein